MRNHVTYSLLGGVTKTYTSKQLIGGFATTVTQNINTGDLLRGNLYVDDVVTPIFNLWNGPTANHSYTMFTGYDDPSLVGSIYSVDEDAPYIWLRNSLFTNVGWTDVKWYNEVLGSAPEAVASPDLVEINNYGYRFGQQNTQNMSNSTCPNGIDADSFSVFRPVAMSQQNYWKNE